MDDRTSMKPALWGGLAGAIAISMIGFTWGGWVTGLKAEVMAEDRPHSAIGYNVPIDMHFPDGAAGPSS